VNNDDITVLDELADAITALTAARTTITPHRLTMDTAINIVVLTRIATQALTMNDIINRSERDTIDHLADDLAAALRRATHGEHA
jgi:hypothetical protein